jgi:hypothetical protein
MAAKGIMRSHPPLDRSVARARFKNRLMTNGGYSAAVIGLSMLIGTVGFHWIVNEDWSLSFLNAAMLLGGMGPVGGVENAHVGGRMFAALFALYAGLIFLIVAGLLLAPVFHRVLHHFHWEVQEEER